jgi:hypothetical protein
MNAMNAAIFAGAFSAIALNAVGWFKMQGESVAMRRVRLASGN